MARRIVFTAGAIPLFLWTKSAAAYILSVPPGLIPGFLLYNGHMKKHPPSSFAARVRAVVAKIPKGKTMAYKEVAARAGRPGAFRAVGNIMSRNFDPKIPCHRVVRSDGRMGGYNRGGVKRKEELLRAERKR